MFVNQTVLDTCNDDRTMLYMCHLNGYRLFPCTKYCYTKNDIGITQLPIAPRSDYQYQVGGKYDAIVAPLIAKLSNGKKIGECFGLFKQVDPLKTKEECLKRQKKQQEKRDEDAKNASLELALPTSWIEGSKQTPKVSPKIEKLFQYNLKTPIRHDLVYVLGNGSKYDNLEIKISITSMMKFCSDWIGKIYVIGNNPGISNPNVIHIYAPDITRTNKDANIINKILTAINNIPTLSENFLFCSDDVLVTCPTKWEDFYPRYIFEYNQDDEFRKQLAERSKNNEWDKLLLKTLDRFVGFREHIWFYEPHIMAPINKRYFQQMCQQIDYTSSRNVIVMSLWFNWLNLDNPLPKDDHTSVFSSNIPDLSDVKRHMSYNDKSFGVEQFREWLIRLVMMEEFK